jgi:peptidoglycan/xylan/chitin deacetylase (PgdA/CDA1 family)
MRNSIKKSSLSLLSIMSLMACAASFAPQSEAATNVIPNPSLETVSGTNSALPANWTTVKFGTNTTTFTYQTTGYTGSRSVKTQITSYTSGDSHFKFDPQTVTASTKYDFSFWYQSNVTTEVDAEITTTGGSTTYLYIGDVPASTTWKQYTGTVTMPSNASKATVYATIYSVGYLTTDDYSLSSQSATPTAATPTFSPVAGTYASAQNVTISDTTAGAQIRYTTDGTTPTASSTLYSGAISVASTKTIKAIAIASGYTNSAVASATYTISSVTPTAATPVFSPVAGTYTSAQNVTISDATAGAAIYYTTNGTTPSASSTRYTAPVSITSTKTLKAIAIASGYNNSAVKSGTYTISATRVSTPAFSPVAGTYTGAQNVSISCATSGATIYYTTNGTTPTTSSTVYSAPISVTSTKTVKALAIRSGLTNSAVASATYTISIPTAATPVFSPVAGTYTSAQNVTISDATAGASIRYTTDGTTPTASSILYSGAISVASSKTLKAIAIASGYNNSAVASAAYTISIPTTDKFTLIQDDTAWDNYYDGNEGSIVTTDKVVGANSVKISTQQRGAINGITKELFDTPLNLTKALRFYVKSTNWNNIQSANILLSSDGYALANTYTYNLRGSLQNPANNEWIEVVVPRSVFYPYNGPDWNYVDFIMIQLEDNGTAANLSVDGLSYFDASAPAGIVSITFDDGWADTYTQGKALMDTYGYKGTAFLMPNQLNTTGYMTTAQVNGLAANGWDLSGHSINNLTTLNDTQLTADVATAANYVSGKQGSNLFAYPNGATNNAVWSKVSSRFSYAFNINGLNQPLTYMNKNSINRQSMDKWTTPADYIEPWIDNAKNNHEWVILNFHTLVANSNIDTMLDYDYNISNRYSHT